jgi:hypothetical protein
VVPVVRPGGSDTAVYARLTLGVIPLYAGAAVAIRPIAVSACSGFAAIPIWARLDASGAYGQSVPAHRAALFKAARIGRASRRATRCGTVSLRRRGPRARCPPTTWDREASALCS